MEFILILVMIVVCFQVSTYFKGDDHSDSDNSDDDYDSNDDNDDSGDD